MCDFEHLNVRKAKAHGSSFFLNKLGFKSNRMNHRLKMFLYKVYCRPNLSYGVENVCFEKAHIELLKSCEGRMLKGALGVTKHANLSLLMEALERLIN